MDTMNIVNVLANTIPFKHLSEETINDLAKKLKLVHFPKSSYVLKQGEMPQGELYVVVSGLLEVIMTNEKGEYLTIDFRRPNDLLGESGFLTGKSFPGSIVAVEETQLLLLKGKDFDQLLLENSSFASHFSKMLAERMRYLYQEVILKQSLEPFALDSQTFRKRAYDIMTNPVYTCHRDAVVNEVAAKMQQNNISSIVVLEKEQKPVGIITEKTLVSTVVVQSKQANLLLASEVMNANPALISPDALFYQVLLVMIRQKQKHVLVVENDKLLGIITPQDLIRSRSSGTLDIVSDIESQTTIVGLNEARKVVDNVLKALAAENVPPSQIFSVITEFNDRLTRKVIEISEQELIEEGHGKPPVQYCFINMGSAGRKEQFLRTDQDNGIIYEDVSEENEEEVGRYFQLLAEKIVDGLAKCGFERCIGNVMATNPNWCRSFSSWRRSIRKWIIGPQDENVRMLTIFLDFRPISGKLMLGELFKRYVIRTIQQTPIILHHLAIDDLASKVPLGLFRQFITEKSKEHKKEINLKNSVCVHVVDCLRIFSLREGILESNTLERLKILTKKQIISRDESEFIENAYQSLMMFRIRESLRKLEQGLEPNNYIEPYKLSKREQAVLKEALLAVDRLQKFTGNVFIVAGRF